MHLHLYMITPVHGLKERDKHLEYSLCYRDVITANREDIRNLRYFNDETVFMYRIASTANFVCTATDPHETEDTP